MRARGYALSELLVAVAIAGLILGTLTSLNVDYIQLGRRVSELQSPYELGARVQGVDPCASPGAVLASDADKVSAQSAADTASLISLVPLNGSTQVMTAQGVAGITRQPVRLVVEATPTPAASMVSIEVGGATVGVVAPRCDLPQVCDYDASNAMCYGDEVQMLAEPG